MAFEVLQDCLPDHKVAHVWNETTGLCNPVVIKQIPGFLLFVEQITHRVNLGRWMVESSPIHNYQIPLLESFVMEEGRMEAEYIGHRTDDLEDAIDLYSGLVEDCEKGLLESYVAALKASRSE